MCIEDFLKQDFPEMEPNFYIDQINNLAAACRITCTLFEHASFLISVHGFVISSSTYHKYPPSLWSMQVISHVSRSIGCIFFQMK